MLMNKTNVRVMDNLTLFYFRINCFKLIDLNKNDLSRYKFATFYFTK